MIPIISHEEIVKQYYPTAQVVLLNDLFAYHPVVIQLNYKTPFILGGGLCEADAWMNAYIHLGLERQ